MMMSLVSPEPAGIDPPEMREPNALELSRKSVLIRLSLALAAALVESTPWDVGAMAWAGRVDASSATAATATGSTRRMGAPRCGGMVLEGVEIGMDCSAGAVPESIPRTHWSSQT